MPRISFFRGISIYMHFSDHPTPHFHEIYAEYEAKISIATHEVIEGSCPRRSGASWPGGPACTAVS